MGFLAATLLLHMPEEEAFWSLAAVIKGDSGQRLRAVVMRQGF